MTVGVYDRVWEDRRVVRWGSGWWGSGALARGAGLHELDGCGGDGRGGDFWGEVVGGWV